MGLNQWLVFTVRVEYERKTDKLQDFAWEPEALVDFRAREFQAVLPSTFHRHEILETLVPHQVPITSVTEI